MCPFSFPAVTAQQRQRFTDAIGQLFSRMILTPAVEWDGHDQARVTLASGGENSAVAAERAREIIDGNAARMAHIYVRDITVLHVESLEGWPA
jgi:predicted acyl esterase